MLVYATMCVKNEADVVGGVLERALSWADRVFVVDNNSDDGTGDIVRRFDGRVEVLATFFGEFQEGLKSIPFNWVNNSRRHPRPDWWCVMDADEVYLDNPRTFLQEVPDRFGRVCTNTIEFLGLAPQGDPLVPLSYAEYVPLDWSESRFFRNTASLRWCSYSDNGPRGVGATYPRRIHTFHFPFRSREQIERRLLVRNRNRKASGISWGNSEFDSADDLLQNYRRGQRHPNDGEFLFLPHAKNFLSSPKQRLTASVKEGLHLLGFYR